MRDEPFDDDLEDEDTWEAAAAGCGMMRNGSCSMAGSEFCDWSCPMDAWERKHLQRTPPTEDTQDEG